MDVGRKYTLFVLIAAGVVLLDQVSKALVLKHMPMFDSITIIPGFFNLTHVHNKGGAFGFLAQGDMPFRHYLFLLSAIVLMAVLIYFYYHTPADHRWLRSALSLIFGGGIGNIIDRVRLGQVVDFLDFHIGSLTWPTFNVADSAVTVGIGIFIVLLLKKKLPY